MTDQFYPGEKPQQERPKGVLVPPPIEPTKGRSSVEPPPASTPPWPLDHPPASGYFPPSYPPPGNTPRTGYPPPYPGPSGHPGAYPGGYEQPSKTNALAIWSLVTSVVGIPLAFICVGGLAAIGGIVLGFIALNQINRSGEQGRGIAGAGIAVGTATLVFCLIVTLAVLGGRT